jgi:Fic family protein
MFGLLEETLTAVGRLDGFVRQQPGGFNIDPWVLFQPLRLREARLSSRIENTIASARDAALSAHRRFERSEPLEVRKYLEALDVGARASGPLTEARVRGLHRVLMEGVPGARGKRPGEYRAGQVYIGDDDLGFARARYVPPPAEQVGRLMRDLVLFLREPPEGMSTLLVIGLAHYQFEAIHPFADGNGRLGRMLITLGLCDHSLLSAPLVYPSSYIDTNKQEYYGSLLAVSTRGDWGRWLRYFLRAVCFSATDTYGRMVRLLELREAYRERVSRRSLSSRMDRVIDLLFEHPVFTARQLHVRVGGSRQTIRNYIGHLLDAEILEEVTGRKKDQVFAAREVLEAADQD